MLIEAATNSPYTLIIESDDHPLNPRKDYDNFGRMVCFHCKYNLGDKHDYQEPNDFFADILSDPSFTKPVFDYIRKGRAEDVKIEYDQTEREWQLISYCNFAEKWVIEASFPPGLDKNYIPTSFLDAALAILPMSAMLEIVSELSDFLILPLYLYDHGGITISTAAFSDFWDSGQIGWIYADHDMIKKEYGDVTEETIANAISTLEGEVKCYDLYLTGQCYGYRLFEDEHEMDSCWGFLGDLDELKDELRACLPEEAQSLVDELSYCHENSIAEYFWNIKHEAS